MAVVRQGHQRLVGPLPPSGWNEFSRFHHYRQPILIPRQVKRCISLLRNVECGHATLVVSPPGAASLKTSTCAPSPRMVASSASTSILTPSANHPMALY